MKWTRQGFLKTTALLFVLVIIVGGCSKNNGTGEGEGENDFYLQFKVNGTEKVYKSNVISQVLPVSSKALHSCILQGYSDFSNAERNLVSMIIWSESPVIAKGYNNSDDATNSDGAKLPQVLITYVDNEKDSYLSQGKPVVVFPPLDKVVSDVQLTITKLEAGRIAGTFSGTLYKTSDASFSSTVKITDGKFNLKRF